MRVTAVIPARYASTRFPGKLMKPLSGKTVIRTTYENVRDAGLFDDTFVVTDSKIIFDEIAQHGGKALMSAKEHETGSDRIAEAVENIDCDVVINIQGDEPFINQKALKQLITIFEKDRNREIDLATLYRKLTDWQQIEDPNCVKVVKNKDDFALYFSRSVIPFPREKNFPAKYYGHIGVYAFRKEALLKFAQLPMRQNEKAEKLENLRYLEYGMKIKLIETDFAGIGIDTPQDLERTEKLIKQSK